MDRQAILENLKRAESDVKARIEAAEKQAAEIRDHATKHAKAIVHEGEQQAANDSSRLLSEARAAYAKDRQRTLSQASSEAEGLKKKAQVKKAEEFFLSQFNESLHV